jgi:hypothetical protein
MIAIVVVRYKKTNYTLFHKEISPYLLLNNLQFYINLINIKRRININENNYKNIINSSPFPLCLYSIAGFFFKCVEDRSLV